MPADRDDEQRRPPAPEPPEAEANASEPTDAGARPDAPPPTPAERRRWRRYVNRRNAVLTSIAAVLALVLLVVVAIFLYRSGQVDSIIAKQIVGTLAQFGVRAEVGSFRTRFGERTAELNDIELYDAATGARLGRVGRLVATVRIEDMYALSLRRNVNLESLDIDGLEMWVAFDAEGRSNFANLRLPEPDPNRRILFSYSTARIKLSNSIVHYDDRRYDISGEARNVQARIEPDDPTAPAESRMNRVELALSDSTLTFDNRPVNPIDITARARVSQTRAEIQELSLRSPHASARLSGTMDDWRALRYQMKIDSTVDLTQASDVLQTGASLRGAGNFVGTVTGEGTRYRVEGAIRSDALAADNVRLKALNVEASATGDGAEYEVQGRAVAELLTAGDFQLSAVQLAGNVMGTGTDFRWLGDLRAAALRNGATTITGLILNDARAELRDGQVTGTARGATAQVLTSSGTTVRGIDASGINFGRAEDGTTNVTASSARAATIVDEDATVRGVTASGIKATVNADESASVVVDRAVVGGLEVAGARVGTLNIAGVRLAIRDGRVQGSSGDINVGTVAFSTGADHTGAGGTANEGRAENVQLARPVFTLEPGGRYRASADLSLGGGVLGTMKLGAARGAVVATNDQVQLNNFTAEILGGSASGDAVIATSSRAASRVAANFSGIDVGGLIATLSGRVVPIVGAATGSVNLQFPGTDFKAASGSLDARFSGETGDEIRGGLTPLTGDLAVRADRGLFRVENINLQTGASKLNARGQFSFEGSSNLDLNITSSDAAELQRVFIASGVAPQVESGLESFGVTVAGDLRIDGTLTGSLNAPDFNTRASIESLLVRGRDLGALSASIIATPAEVRIDDGRLAERDGGGARFTAVIPRSGENNITVNATLDDANTANLLAILPAGAGGPNIASLAGLGAMSGEINVTGIPDALGGSANLRAGPGSINGEAFDQIVARATFNGSNINLENLDARFRSGRVMASGNINISDYTFDLRAKGDNVQLGVLAAIAGGGLPQLGGAADFTANASGNLDDPRSLRVELNAEGRDVTVNGQPAGALTLVGRTTDDQKFKVDLTTGILGQTQVVTALVDLANEELPATIETTLTGADLTQLFKTILPSANVTITGRATGTLKVSGNLFGEEGFASALRGRAEFTELELSAADVSLAAESPLVVLFTGNEIIFERTRFTGPGTNLLFGGTAAIGEGGRQDLTVNGELNLRVLDNLSPNLFLAGAARVGVNVTGTFAAPRLTGLAEVTGASFSTLVTDERLTVANINGRVRFTTNQAEIESFTGTLGGGRIALSGGALLEGLRPSLVRLDVRANGVTVPFPDGFRSTADANLQLRGTLNEQLIEGVVNLRRAEYTENIDLADLINRRRNSSITEGGGGAGFGVTTLDLQVEGRDALVVRNNLADVVGSVSLRVRGTADDPVVSGRITATRGTLNFRNDRYDLTRAYIDLPPQRDADPLLNIQAETEIRGYRLTVALTGPLSQPSTTLRSDPTLPQADVVSLITTGNLASGDQSASTLAQTGFGTATSLLTDTLINAPVQRATDRLFGLNRFEIDPLIAGRGGASPTARLTVGRQINRNLSVTYSTNVTSDQNQVVAVEYRVSDRLSFVAQYQQGAVNGLRAEDDSFSFEIRFRKRF